ncbi:uncharacterized protein LOC135085797 [Ostrinia nubilalis]|uniref:uncharacterized protein LOC135085797 n=1 Tax=Ostrinia nubilalis TaxID=29057 RepID=UPI0030825BA7
MLDGTELVIPCKIEDDFHVATPEILKLVSSPEDRRKLLWYQAYMDWKYCLTPDDDDNLPIHLAVLNDDVHLLKRQCLVLKTRKESVDVTNGDNMTALQLSILAKSPACTALLAQLNANPLVTDEEYRSCFHLAAEAGGEYLEPLVRRCREDPLTILRNNEELWKPEVAAKTKDFQVKHLLHKVCTMFDSQGYTPLMLASKLGKHDSVQALVSAAPASIDYRSTSSGETAFYLAVSAACTDSAQRGNKSKVFDDFKQTIIHLVEAGADPNIDNYSGNDISTLLADFSNSDLSMIIASKRTAINCKEFDDKLKEPAMLVKERDGTIMNLKEKLKKTKEINRIKGELKKESKGKGRRAKPVIIENKVISKPKASNEYINTYKNFVHDLKNPMLVPKTNQRKLIKYDYSDSKPSTSKTAPLTAKSIVISPSKSKEPNLSLKVEKESTKDPLNIDTNIKKEVDAIKSEENQNNSTAKAEKRKIIIQSDIPIGPITKVVKSSPTLNR